MEDHSLPKSNLRSRAPRIPEQWPLQGRCFRLAAVLIAVAGLCQAPGCSSRRSAAEPAFDITDEVGRLTRLRPNPQRIVSLAPSLTETLFALGLDDRIVGVTSYCDYPAQARTKESVGDTLRPNIEKIVSLKADLVIISTASQLEQPLRRLEELGIPVYVSNPRDLEGTLKSIERIGEITGVPDRAREVTARLRSRIDAVRSHVETRPQRKVFFILGTQPLISIGSTSFITDLIARAGGRSISAEETADYPSFSMETALARQPEVIFLQAGGGSLPETLKRTPAARSGRVYKLDDALLLRPGPRIVEGLEQMAWKIHPE